MLAVAVSDNLFDCIIFCFHTKTSSIFLNVSKDISHLGLNFVEMSTSFFSVIQTFLSFITESSSNFAYNRFLNAMGYRYFQILNIYVKRCFPPQ